MIGKPYSGKLNVRFDEGELEIERPRHYASSLLYPTPLGRLLQYINPQKSKVRSVSANMAADSSRCSRREAKFV
jgi:hypothetical protein